MELTRLDAGDLELVIKTLKEFFQITLAILNSSRF